jgi:hypothetical protein
MDKLNIYYHIVPKNDGYTYLCRSNNELFLARKDAPAHRDELIFEDLTAAEKFIEDNNLQGYKVEAFLRR